ncbi:hypothetical protein QFC22_002844 [Naganishia vaughanmartiniae]|uniref:Uncharacterized protein n=1 Tax=Naganishia vaughanmartiniae TaxID=1424756 RepID=A0ACC2XA63_9TREE|nr:hypothetical protein QFC22_002844 [Naganishia vaughanmartiniae]
MSAMDIDKGLDEIMATRKTANKSKRGGAAAGGAKRGGAAAGGARARYAGNVPVARGAQQQAVAPLSQATRDSLKIIISNLPTDVDEAAVRIEVVIDFSTAPLASRLAPAAPAVPAARPRAAAGAARGGAARGGKAKRGGKRGAERPAKTQEELDKEMTDYVNASTTPAA